MQMLIFTVVLMLKFTKEKLLKACNHEKYTNGNNKYSHGLRRLKTKESVLSAKRDNSLYI